MFELSLTTEAIVACWEDLDPTNEYRIETVSGLPSSTGVFTISLKVAHRFLGENAELPRILILSTTECADVV